MYFDGNITFKGTTSGSLGVIVSSMPKMQHSTVKATEYDIPLRDGIQYSSWRNRTDAQITVKFAIVKDNNIAYIQALRATRQWLEGTGVLILDNNPGVYYNVKKVEITDEEMFTLSSGELEATFVVEPFEYMRTDTEFEQIVPHTTSPHENPIIVRVHNDGDLCKPLISITPLASGEVTTAYNFGTTLTIDEEPDCVIVYPSKVGTGLTTYAYCDTSLMYTYLTNGTTVTLGEEYFTQHNYEDLWIPNGTHDIRFTNVALNNYSTKVNIKLRKGYVI